MAREIRFRAWCKKSKEMCEVTEIDFVKKEVELWHSSTTDYTLKLLKNVELMEYTSLKDKNGKEIYEGDLVSFMDKNKLIGVVEFLEGSYILRYLKLNTCPKICGEWLSCFEVIGNIYENPEML